MIVFVDTLHAQAQKTSFHLELRVIDKTHCNGLIRHFFRNRVRK
jgi:hypothetical protein